MSNTRAQRSPDPALQRARRIALAALAALSLTALSGCETWRVAVGSRLRLDDVPLQSIAAAMPGNGGLAPGASARLSVVATTTDGRTLATVGTGDGKVLADSYVYEASVASVDAKGVVRLPADPRASENRLPHVRIHVAGQPAPVAELDIPVRYDVPFTATFAGATGSDGLRGQDGLDGWPGSLGSLDPDHPVSGGNGGNGGDGHQGGDGDDGGPGPDLQVTVTLRPGATPRLRVRVHASGRDQFFIVDPAGGSLALAARGGAGGSAGWGGRGGRGGSGGAGLPPGGSGLDGQPGGSGRPGRGGIAGSVRVAVDPAAARYLDRLHVTNEDGDGRPGPAPVVTIAPVAALW